jgi:protein SCO1/2
LNRCGAFAAAFYATVSLCCAVAAARAAEPDVRATGPDARAAGPFRLTEWPSAARKPSFHLLDANHERRGLADYRGRVSIVFFGFTHCPDVCPSELLKLALVVKRLESLASQVQVLFISLDPERDTPELVKAYVAAFDPRFVGLTGSSADVNEAASSFSIQFAKVRQGGDYTINHSTGVYILDKTGRLRLVGTLETSVDDLVHDLTKLATG